MLFLERSNPVNWWYVLHLHFLRLWRNFFSSIHLVYLSEKEDIIDPEHVSKTRKIDQTLKIHKLERKCRQNGDTDIFFFKISDVKDSFYVQWYGGENEIIRGHFETSESDDKWAKCQGSHNEDEEWLCCLVYHQW